MNDGVIGIVFSSASLVAQMVKKKKICLQRRRPRFDSWVGKIPWKREWLSEKAVGTHSSTLAWRISWMEEPGRLQSMGSLSVGHD